jgi:putative ABC transport system permease protein
MAQGSPLAFKQLAFERMKLVTAISGVMVAVMLMWIQLGMLAALYDSATVVHRGIKADLVVLHPLADTLNRLKPFSVRTLYRARGYPGVAAIGELLNGPVEWRHPVTGKLEQIQTYGLDPEEEWIDLPGVREHRFALRAADTLLYDRNSRAVFGPVVAALESGAGMSVELNHRLSQVVGLTSLAASFGQQGNIITSRANYLRLHPGHPPEQVHIGMIRLRPGEDTAMAKAVIGRMLAPEAMVMTPPEFVDFELRFWKANAPVGFIFTTGTAIGFFIGFVVVYQILYSDVTNNLPYFATMKAIGFSDRALLRLVVKQGLILSVLGYLPGSVLAIAFYQVIQAGTSIPVRPTWDRFWMLFALTFLMCLMSGAMATRKLRSADPADVF